MDIKSQKERLEQELRFLKESFEAEVISKEEFEKGKERIERKLNEIDYIHKSDVESEIEDEKPSDSSSEEDENTDSNEEETEAMAKNETKSKSEQIPQKETRKSKIDNKNNPEPASHVSGQDNKNRSSGFWKYATIFLIFIILIFLAFNFIKIAPSTQNATKIKIVLLCSTDKDCMQAGKEGTCENPNQEDAKCIYADIKKTRVIILNDKQNCINCETSRVISILDGWMGPLNASEVSYSTSRGKELTKEYGAKVLPFYIVDDSISEKENFLQFQKSFTKKSDSYILNDRVAGASLYIERPQTKKKLDLFVREGDNASKKAEQNLQEFLSNFGVDYEKHSSNSQLAKDLGLNSFPAFLVNNMATFSGVHTAESIRQNYCKLNEDDNCDKKLSTNLK